MNCASFAFGNALCRMVSDIDGAHHRAPSPPGSRRGIAVGQKHKEETRR